MLGAGGIVTKNMKKESIPVYNPTHMKRRILLLLLVATPFVLAACDKTPLADRLLSDDPVVREKAFAKLAKMAPAKRSVTVPVLMAALEHPEARINQRAGDALVIVGAPAVSSLTEALKSELPFVRICAAEALGRIPQAASTAVVPLTEALKDPHPLVREEAAFSLGAFGARADSATPALTKLLKDPMDGVRETAAESLKRIAGTPVPSSAKNKL